MHARSLRPCLALLAALVAGCVTPGTEQDVEARLERAAAPLVAGRKTRVYPIWAETRIVAFGLLTEAKGDPASPLSLRLSRSIALAARRGQSVVVGGPYPELCDRVLQNVFELNREEPLRGLRLVLVSSSPPTPELASAASRARANLYHRPF
jgi:hypothetical protein